MTGLTSRQRSALRALAHGLDAVVLVGKAGVTDAVVREVDEALAARELIKVRLAGDRQERDAAADAVASGARAEIAGRIGRVAILYRRHPDPARRRIELPPG
jgi:RNA-binding protein